MFIIFLILSIVLSVTASVPACPPGGTVFNPPQNLSIWTEFPSKANGSNSYFPANYLCNYKINVPPGLFANVIIYYSLNQTDENSKIVVTDQSNFSETLTRASYGDFYFVSNGGNILLSTGISEASFNLNILWKKLPAAFTPMQIQLNVSNTEPSTIQIDYPNQSYLVTAETRVSILALSSIFDSDKFFLRGIYVYDGPTWNSTLMGSAMQLWRSNKQWVSTGNQLTVQFLFNEGNRNQNRSQLALQDYENTKHIVNYYCGYCIFDNYETQRNGCQFILDNSLGTTAVMTSLDPDYGNVETIEHLNGNGTLDVYLGGITQSKSNLVVSYPVQNPGLTLPQDFAGTIRTYVLEGVHSRAVMNLTRYSSVQKNSIGTKKLLMSSYYPQLHADQYVWEKLKTPNDTGSVTFSYHFQCADIARNATLKIVVQNGNKSTYNNTFTASSPPPINQTFNIIGDYMTVFLSSKEGESKGLLMEYEIFEAGASRCHLFVLVAFVSVLVMSQF